MISEAKSLESWKSNGEMISQQWGDFFVLPLVLNFEFYTFQICFIPVKDNLGRQLVQIRQDDNLEVLSASLIYIERHHVSGLRIGVHIKMSNLKDERNDWNRHIEARIDDT